MWTNSGWRSDDGGWYKNASSVLPGPPTFVGRNASGILGFSGANPTYTSTLDLTGSSAVATRYVVVMFYVSDNVIVSNADFGGLGNAFFTAIGDDTLNNRNFYAAGQVVPTGSSVVLTITVNNTIFSQSIVTWTATSTDFVSLTPVTNFSSGASPPVQTTVPVLTNGSVLSLSYVNGGTLSGPSFTTPNDPGMASDISNGFAFGGSANSSAAFASARVNVTATGSGTGIGTALAAFR
jgi:hypothetical protein